MRTCEAIRYAQQTPCGQVSFTVVYRNPKGKVIDQHPACFVHGIAEVDRHHESGGIASCDLIPEGE